MFRKFFTPLLVAIAILPLLFASAADAQKQQPLTFTVMRKGDEIGTHVISFEQDGDLLNVTIRTRIAVKVMFVTAYKFTFDGTEAWKDGKLFSLSASTNDNGEKHDVNVERNGDKLLLTADGKSQEISADTIPASWWNIKLTGRKELLDVLTGKMQQVTIKKIGSEKVKAGGKDTAADHYQVSGGLQRDIWYTPDGALIRQAVLKKGDLIEYVVK